MIATIENEELLDFLYQCPVGIAQIDGRGVISLLNAKGSQLLMPVASGSALDNLFDILDAHEPSLRALASNPGEGYGPLCDHRLIRLDPGDGRDFSAFYLAITLLKIGPETIMAVFEDVTRVTLAEAEARELLTAQALERGRSELAAEVLHDIGNAVVGIGTRSASLLEDSLWPELVQLGRMADFLGSRGDALAGAFGPQKAGAMITLIGEIRDSLQARRQRAEESMLGFVGSVHHIQEILNLHRHYARQPSPGGRERISVFAILQDALTIQGLAFEKRRIAVERRVAPGLPKLGLDRTRMIQVFVNLLKNVCEAFDACPPAGGRRLAIEAEVTEGGECIRVTFADNACGFEAGRAEPFFEKHHSTKGQGSGIGLYHCRSIVESHGGTITLRSDGPGLGASAIVTLPISPLPEPES